MPPAPVYGNSNANQPAEGRVGNRQVSGNFVERERIGLPEPDGSLPRDSVMIGFRTNADVSLNDF